MQKPLVVVCAGKDSLHCTNRWNRGDLRNFELWIVAYDEDTSVEGADQSFRCTGTKWDLIRQVATHIREATPPWLWLPDDDLAVDVLSVNAFFEALGEDVAAKGTMAQPSLNPRNVSCAELVHRPCAQSPTLAVGFIEIQMPCVSRSLIPRLLAFLADNEENKSGWGLDCVWSEWAGVDKYLVNTVVVVHTRPVNLSGGFYAKLGIDPVAEKDHLLAKYKQFSLC